MTNKQWFQLHTWAGVFLGALLLFVCFTGTIASVSHEIEYLIDEKFRALTPRTKVDFQQLETELSKAYPNSYLQRIQIRPERYLSGEAQIVTNNLLSFIYFDPNTGKILGKGNWGRLTRFLRDIHRKLSMGNAGKFLITTLSLLLLITLVSSFFIYKDWWRHFFKQPNKLKLSTRATWSSWHKIIGLWSWWFIATVSITSFWYFIDQTLQTAGIEYYPQKPQIQSSEVNAKPASLTKILINAQAAFKSLEISYIRYPNNTKKPIEIRGFNHDFLVVDRANRVYLHPVTAEVLKVQPAAELSAYSRLTDTVDLIHFGSFFGLTSKIIWFIFGLLMSFMIASGIYMAWLKAKRKQPSVIKWQGISGILTIIICIVGVVLTTINVALPKNESVPFSPQLSTILTYK
ncbi:PepSY-associated TM helix domain-containing protein [Cognaticolwellia mytili]|uniref:PepSY-associated TM helix domain-containing protein n=1 Tax=Cognaticolwellia mytili TaxID=1888913 RepID=UPI000A173E5B|nr:PepSY-associated TM helix domain-containing protein [Cognaticolwellia mytili]